MDVIDSYSWRSKTLQNLVVRNTQPIASILDLVPMEIGQEWFSLNKIQDFGLNNVSEPWNHQTLCERPSRQHGLCSWVLRWMLSILVNKLFSIYTDTWSISLYSSKVRLDTQNRTRSFQCWSKTRPHVECGSGYDEVYWKCAFERLSN